MSRIKLSLIENSHSFACEALGKAVLAEKDPNQWKFAIFNIVQAIELLLKEKLRREHSILIYADIDKPRRTVSLELALSRLKNIANIDFSEDDLDSVRTASEWRNRIVHFEYEFTVTELKLVFSRLLGFVAHFHDKFLGSPLSSVVPSAVWDDAVSILDYGSELYKRAKLKMDEKGIDESLVWHCRWCGQPAFVIQDDDFVCYVCGKTDYVVQCKQCNVLVYADEAQSISMMQDEDESNMILCPKCYRGMLEDAAADYKDRQRYEEES